MSRIYANENFPRPVVLELRRLGHDVLTVEETGKADQSLPDEAVLKFAGVEGRAVVTINRLQAPLFFSAAKASMVSMDSLAAASMKLHVLTMMTSASSGSGTGTQPASRSFPVMTSLSTRLRAHPKLTR